MPRYFSNAFSNAFAKRPALPAFHPRLLSDVLAFMLIEEDIRVVRASPTNDPNIEQSFPNGRFIFVADFPGGREQFSVRTGTVAVRVFGDNAADDPETDTIDWWDETIAPLFHAWGNVSYNEVDTRAVRAFVPSGVEPDYDPGLNRSVLRLTVGMTDHAIPTGRSLPA